MAAGLRYRKRTYVFASLAVGLASAIAVPFVGSIIRRHDEPPVPPASPVSLPARAGMSVFRQSDTALSPRLRQQIADQTEILTGGSDQVPKQWWPGVALWDDARLLMTNLGAGRRLIYAFPTSRGRVCSGLTHFSAGCIDGFRRRLGNVSLTYGDAAVGGPGIVWGLAPDVVSRVEVYEAGRWHRARLENNAYFYEGHHSIRTMSRLKVVYRRGAAKVLPLAPTKRTSKGGR